MGSGSDLTNAQWERLAPLLPVSNGRCGRWRDHRQVVNGLLFHHAAGARHAPPPTLKGGSARTVTTARVRAELIERLAEVVREVRRSAARAAGLLPRSTVPGRSRRAGIGRGWVGGGRGGRTGAAGRCRGRSRAPDRVRSSVR
ncbi:transposase [Streptomyces olivaceoviridis]